MGGTGLNPASDANPWYFTKASDGTKKAVPNLKFDKVSNVNTQTSVTSADAYGLFMTDDGGTGDPICVAQQV